MTQIDRNPLVAGFAFEALPLARTFGSPRIRAVGADFAEARRKGADKRLVTGVIGKYGAPEERMSANYRRHGSFSAYLRNGLRLTDEAVARLKVLAGK